MLIGSSAVRGKTAAWAVLSVLCAVSASIVVILGTKLTFFNDDWWFLLQRPGLESGGGLDVLLAPHNGNIVFLLALLYRLLVALFGLGSQLPFRLLLGITMAVLGVLVFVLVTKRLGPVVGLAGAAVVLLLGPAWEILLFFAAFSHLGALTLGVAALLAMEADTRRRNAVACLLLVCATLLFNLGLPFLVGAAIVIALRRRPFQLWIPGIPVVLYALWWFFYGRRQPSNVTLANVEHLPRYVLDSISFGLTSVTGLNHGSPASALARGHILATIVVLAALFWLSRGARPSRWSLVLVSTALTFWVLSGAAQIPGRAPSASRYQLFDVVFLILVAAELLREVRIPRSGQWAVGLAAVLVVASNLASLKTGFDFMRDHAGYVDADLGALEIAGPRAAGDLALLAPVARDPYLSGVTAGRYFAQVRVHGSPFFDTPPDLAAATPGERQAADSVLASAYRLMPRPTAAAAPRVGVCRRLDAGGLPPAYSLALASGSTLVKNRNAVPVVVAIRRFAPGTRPIYIGFLAARSSSQLSIPRDSVTRPWRMSIGNPKGTPGVAVAVCEGR